MPDPVTALVGGGASIVSSFLGGQDQADEASEAAGAQVEAARLGIKEQRRQFEAIQKLLSPYVQTGTGALGAQGALLGLSGPQAQQEAIAALESSPQFQALTQQGESALLQQASATGGLRGGNLQSALAQFRPQMLSQLIESQFGRLGSVAGLGQASAAGVGAAGQQTGANIANLLGQQGAAQAGAALARGQAQANIFGTIGSTIGTLGTLKGLGAF